MYSLSYCTISISYTRIISGSPRVQSGTSSISTSGAEDGSSPESPAPSLPPKPSFSYSNVQTPQILGNDKHDCG